MNFKPLESGPIKLGLQRFAPEIERAFQESYYMRLRPTLRISIGLGVFLGLFFGFVSASQEMRRIEPSVGNYLAFAVLILINLLLFAFSLRRSFVNFWQPSFIGVVLVSMAILSLTKSSTAGFASLVYFLLIVCRVQHLQVRWTVLQLLGVVIIEALTLQLHPEWSWSSMVSSMVAFSLLMCFSLGSAIRKEQFERNDFFTKHSLTLERNEERQKREQTEKMLHILSQAIGGIVHDLGNPLTTVQGGAETLLSFIKDDEVDKAMVQEFAEMITEGAQMLNYLRLSLMEQTRVLEGKPTPVDLKPTDVRSMVKAGAHYQKPRFSSGRTVSFQGEDLEICVDEMRFITVFMNLIGNALKYSDGEVRISWRTAGEQVLIAIQDQGLAGKGISQTQAQQLFVPFGRLDTHSQVEGTGLGLLSVRKIAQAHEGEAYIEGYTDGTANSSIFSTAEATYPLMLEENFRTAFITACPLKNRSVSTFRKLPSAGEMFLPRLYIIKIETLEDESKSNLAAPRPLPCL